MRRIIKKVIRTVFSVRQETSLSNQEEFPSSQSMEESTETVEVSLVTEVQKTDTIDKVWHCHPRAKEVFARYHLHSCNNCSVRFDETVEEAALVYDFSAEELLFAINTLLREEL